MKKRKAAKVPYLVPLGRTATFYVPAQKMDDPMFGRDGRSATQLFDEFFLQHFGGFVNFLSDMCRLLQEESIYVTMGDRSWLVTPRES